MEHLERIADYVARRQPVADAALERARHALVDFTGVALAGSDEPVSRIVARRVARTSRGSATVIGEDARAGAADAALANATAGHALDFDDSSFVLGGHPTVTMMPALLAVAEERGSSGREVLEAYVAGFEVMMKLARAVNFEHYEKGWHPTATLGTFGTAAAVSRLVGLTAEKARHALGLAASMASGVKANFGAMAKPLQVGQASQKGVLCALLAEDGATASPGALEGRQGFLEVYNGPGRYRADALSGFGEEPEILASGLMFKKYPCCGATHAPIDAALELVGRQALRADEIVSVTIGLNRRRLPHVDRPVVRNGLEGKFSVQYTVAAALADGAIGLRHFADAVVARPDLQALTARVRAEGRESGEALSEASELTVRLKDGGTRSIRKESADGRASEHYPRYMEAKFLDCAGQVADPSAARALFARLGAFAGSPTVAGVMEAVARCSGVEKRTVA